MADVPNVRFSLIVLVVPAMRVLLALTMLVGGFLSADRHAHAAEFWHDQPIGSGMIESVVPPTVAEDNRFGFEPDAKSMELPSMRSGMPMGEAGLSGNTLSGNSAPAGDAAYSVAAMEGTSSWVPAPVSVPDQHPRLGAGSCPPDDGDNLDWIDGLKVGYDGGFLIASKRERDLGAKRYPFRLRLNGWGQIRHTITNFTPPNRDLNQFQLKRGRLVFSGSAFNPNFSYFVQLDGRSSSGDDVRLLDYYLNYDLSDLVGLDFGSFGFRSGKYKMPFTMARWLSGRDFEFTDRSVASTFFDVNRSFAWGLYGDAELMGIPMDWEVALFNGLVTGGAETGSSGTLDDNFAYSGRIFAYPIGDWGDGALADFECHDRLAMRCGFGFASSQIDRSGSTEFGSVRVVDSGNRLSAILPLTARSYFVSLYAIDASFKYRGWSTTLEYYFRSIGDIEGTLLSDLYDHGFWFQIGRFVVPNRLQLSVRWSRVVGDSGTLGAVNQSADEIGAAAAWHFKRNHAKLVADVTNLDGAPINSAALDISPGNRGWMFRSQIQFSF